MSLRSSDPRVVNRVFGVAVSEVILDEPQVVTLIRQVKPARMMTMS